MVSEKRKGIRVSATLSVRLDDKLKKDFLETISEVGLDASSVIRMLAVQTVKQRRIPLSLSADCGIEAVGNTMDFLDSARADWGDWA
jgi:addiction module RelB/DinJ family antitoxin